MAEALSFRARIMRAGQWSILGHAGSQVLRLASNLIMTRLLAEELFGIMALITAITVLVALLSDVGIRQTIVYSERGESKEMLGTAWSMQIIRGVVMWIVCLLIAGVIWLMQSHGGLPPNSVYAEPNLPLYIAATCFVSVINGFDSTKLYLADRSMNARAIAKIEILSQLIGIVSMVALTFVTKSIWALILGSWITALALLYLSHRSVDGPKDRVHWDKDCAKEIIQFGRWILMSSVLSGLAGNVDRLILGALLTLKELALYQIAFMLIFTTEATIHRVISGIAVPALSEVNRTDPKRLRSVYWKFRRPIDAGALAISGFLFVVSPLIIGILYTSKWRPAAEIMSVLAVGLVVARYGVTNALCLATGNPKYQSFLSMCRTISLLVGIPLGYALAGVQGCYWAVGLHAMATLPLYFWYQQKLGVQDWKLELVSLLWWPLGFGVGWLVMQAARHVVPGIVGG